MRKNKKHILPHYKVGDVVVLRSGGPYMTVDDIDVDKGILECIWFTDEDEKEHDRFRAEVLDRVDDSEDYRPDMANIENGSMPSEKTIEEENNTVNQDRTANAPGENVEVIKSKDRKR
ncbi:MAG: DUF2158 domain-containing protein [Chitinophagales bacterium]|nr:DUF2158 domain-containing protein [Chitinophagales bacterium]